MLPLLPDHIDPWRAAKSGLSFAGELPLARFPRLLDVGILDAAARVAYRLDFRRDAQRRVVIEGWARMRLRLLCQRCLSDLQLELDTPLALHLVRAEPSAGASEGHYERLVVAGDSLDPFDLIEDELLLAIPLFPRHPIGECQAPEPVSSAVNSTHKLDRLCAEGLERAPNPFAVLKCLKQG